MGPVAGNLLKKCPHSVPLHRCIFCSFETFVTARAIETKVLEDPDESDPEPAGTEAKRSSLDWKKRRAVSRRAKRPVVKISSEKSREKIALETDLKQEKRENKEEEEEEKEKDPKKEIAGEKAQRSPKSSSWGLFSFVSSLWSI